MAYDLETAKERLGIVGNAEDALVQECLDIALNLVEVYCNRKFGFEANEVEMVVPNSHPHSLQVHRIPAVTINSVTSENGQTLNGQQYTLDAKSGILYLNGGGRNSRYAIDYDGGVEIEGAILTVLWPLVDALYQSHQPSSGSIVSKGTVKKTNLVGVGSIEYDTSSGSSGDTNGIMNSFGSLLEMYRINEA